MKDKEKAAEEEKKETKPEENGVKLTDEQLEQVTGGKASPKKSGSAITTEDRYTALAGLTL